MLEILHVCPEDCGADSMFQTCHCSLGSCWVASRVSATYENAVALDDLGIRQDRQHDGRQEKLLRCDIVVTGLEGSIREVALRSS